LNIIPVIDVLNGIVVHAIKGLRKEYKPLQSSLIDSIHPFEVAKSLKTLGFSQLYIADLDAIITCSMNFQMVKQISDETGLELMVDAGVTSIERAQHLLDCGAAELIVGTETLQSKSFVEEAIKRFGSNRVLVSLDMKEGKVLVKEGFDGSREPLSLLGEFKRMGVSQVIVLDLGRVGSGEGVDIGFLKKVIDMVGVDVYVGGGVRNINDLVELKKNGISGALVATALHNGRISIDELKQLGFF
jgi:phosphoribosylformimino-5-aminoimidazole carboxamide ribotide isomerase